MRHVTVDDALANGMSEGPWWVAHEFPERPPDEWVLWSWNCDGCILHLIAAAHLAHDDVAHTVTEEVTVTTIANALAAAREFRAEAGLRAL